MNDKRYIDVDWKNGMRIRFDYNNMLAENVGSAGITEADIMNMRPRFTKAVENMRNKRKSMEWRELPYQNKDLSEDIKQTAKYIQENYDAFVVFGIGGSALGPIAVHTALNNLRYKELDKQLRKTPKFYVEDNIDPERIRSLFQVIDPKRTMFNVITKSGNTPETMAQMLIITDVLKKALGSGFSKNLIATTDELKGNLIKIASEYGIKTYYIPSGVGGRFSELCPVGLLPAAVCGIDIEELLAGAAYMDSIIESSDSNPAYMFGALSVIAYEKGNNISVMMPYADSLKYIADWYAQLWAESLGKRLDNDNKQVFCGQTPVKALGVTDQHSQIQLYTEGGFDKVVTFIKVDRFREEVTIPHELKQYEDISYLCGHTLNELISAELFGTEYAISKSGHLNNMLILSEVNAFTIGQLLYFFEVATAFAGELLNINAFDQPGVEEGKNVAYALLNRKGYEDKLKELQSIKPKDEKYIK